MIYSAEAPKTRSVGKLRILYITERERKQGESASKVGMHFPLQSAAAGNKCASPIIRAQYGKKAHFYITERREESAHFLH